MADWDWSFNGVAFGGTSSINVSEVSGWLDLPDVRSADTPRAGKHGLAQGRDLAGGRLIRISCEVHTGDPAATEAIVAPLRSVLTIGEDEYPLIGQTPGLPALQVMCRPRRRAQPLKWDASIGAARLELEFVATDPLLYAATESTASTALGTLSGGLSFPAAAPFVFGTSGTSAVMSCPNDGPFPTPWTATFAGPLTAPELVHLETGYRMSFPSAVLTAGETLVVSSKTATVLLNGTASRYSWLASTSQWFDLQPSSLGTNSVQLLGSAGSGTVTMAWRSAWI